MATNPQEFDFDIGDVTGEKGDTGKGIKSIALLSTSGLVKTYRITMTDDTTFDFSVSDGEDGDDGNGISDASFDQQTNALTITFDDGTSFTTPSLKGSPGTPGDDGYSPAVTIETITGGHRVTITDEDHPHGQSFDVLDGQGGGGDVNDVRVNNTSVLVDGIANVPAASANTYGVVKTGEFYGTKIVSGKLTINAASPGDIKEGETNYRPIAPLFADYAAFYGLARAAGDTSQALSPNTVGNYTDNAKTAIKNMLGVNAGGIAYDSTETYQAGTVGAELSNQSRHLSDLEDSISDAYDATASYAVGDFCINDNTLYRCNTAIPTGGEAWTPAHWDAVQIVDLLGHGDGAVSDVQIDGTSILEDGVANIPKATDNSFGVVKGWTRGVSITAGQVQISVPNDASIKAGSSTYGPVTIAKQHAAAFYGLAKAAGDTTQAQSSNPVGTYTEDAKSAIHEMLNGAVTVSGTTPTIAAKSGITYVCGEVATLDITPPASGIFEVQFVSGSTPTVLTATGVTWANGFDPTALEANKTYDISVSNGIGVAVWI